MSTPSGITTSFGAIVFAIAATLTLPVCAQTVIDEWTAVAAPEAPVLSSAAPDVATTALLVMDFNARTCTPEMRVRCHAIIPAVANLIAHARASGMKIIYTHGPNMQADQFVTALAPQGDEPIYQRPFNKFYGSDLEADLRAAGIETLILTSTAGVGAVFATGAGAAERGFNIIVPVDGLASDTAYEDQFAVWYLGTSNTFRGKSILTRSDMITFPQ